MADVQESRNSVCHPAVWVLALTAILYFPQFLPAAERPDGYTLFVELHRPYERNRATLQKMLKKEGHESFVEREGELALVLTASQIEKLFQAKVRLREVEASSFSGTITQPTLESVRIPVRFRKLIRGVYFDPQRG